jgi:hypothetical protein
MFNKPHTIIDCPIDAGTIENCTCINEVGTQAFAALLNNGTVITWGRADIGGDSTTIKHKLVNIEFLYSNKSGFSALSHEGKVVTWGHWSLVDDSAKVQDQLVNIKNIYATSFAPS